LGPRPQNSRRVSLARREPPEVGTMLVAASQWGMHFATSGFDDATNSAGVTQLVESQFSKLMVGGLRELSSRPAEVNAAGHDPQALGPRPKHGRCHHDPDFTPRSEAQKTSWPSDLGVKKSRASRLLQLTTRH